MEIYLILLFLAGLVAMDTTSGPQVLISEPLVSCSILGIFLGNIETGVILGIFFQLLWIGYLPLGAVHFAETNIAAFISAASILIAENLFSFDKIYLNAAMIPAVIMAVIISIVGLKFTIIERKMNSSRIDNFLSNNAPKSAYSITLNHFYGIVLAFSKGVLLAILFVPFVTLLCFLINFLPQIYVKGMSISTPMLWGLVTATAIFNYWQKGKKAGIILGTAGGLVWITILGL